MKFELIKIAEVEYKIKLNFENSNTLSNWFIIKLK